MLIVNLFAGDDLVALVSGAQQVKRKEDAPELWRRVENLAITAGIPMPRIFIVDDDAPNAFAAGRNPKQAIVRVSTGLLGSPRRGGARGRARARDDPHPQLRRAPDDLGGGAGRLDRADRADLPARAFLRRRATATTAAAGTCSCWSRGRWRDPGADRRALIQTAISRRREYVADAAGAELTRYPQGLASALRTISATMKPSAHSRTRRSRT